MRAALSRCPSGFLNAAHVARLSHVLHSAVAGRVGIQAAVGSAATRHHQVVELQSLAQRSPTACYCASSGRVAPSYSWLVGVRMLHTTARRSTAPAGSTAHAYLQQARGVTGKCFTPQSGSKVRAAAMASRGTQPSAAPFAQHPQRQLQQQPQSRDARAGAAATGNQLLETAAAGTGGPGRREEHAGQTTTWARAHCIGARPCTRTLCFASRQDLHDHIETHWESIMA